MVPEHEHPAPEFWDVVGSLHPLATLAAAIIAGVIAWRAIQQRSKADRRSEWWSRAQWALDASLAYDNDRQEMGLKVVRVLTKSELATEEEIEIIDVASEQPLVRAARRSLDHRSTLGDDGSSDKRVRAKMSTKMQAQQSESNTRPPGAEAETARSEERVEIEAAKLRVLVNERLKRPTEPWIVDLSKKEL